MQEQMTKAQVKATRNYPPPNMNLPPPAIPSPHNEQGQQISKLKL